MFERSVLFSKYLITLKLILVKKKTTTAARNPKDAYLNKKNKGKKIIRSG